MKHDGNHHGRFVVGGCPFRLDFDDTPDSGQVQHLCMEAREENDALMTDQCMTLPANVSTSEALKRVFATPFNCP
jgi:hypothetical protein